MNENPYESSLAETPLLPKTKRRSRYLAYAVLTAGMLILVQGVIAFYFRLNVLTGTRYGASLMPVYLIFWGIGVTVAGLVVKTFAERKQRTPKSYGD